MAWGDVMLVCHSALHNDLSPAHSLPPPHSLKEAAEQAAAKYADKPRALTKAGKKAAEKDAKGPPKPKPSKKAKAAKATKATKEAKDASDDDEVICARCTAGRARARDGGGADDQGQ